MEIIQLCSGPVSTNTYVLIKDGSCLVIDPSCDLDGDVSHILHAIGDRHVVGIWLTHGHYDHILGVDSLVNHVHCPVYISSTDAPLLKDPSKNASAGNPIQITVSSPVRFIPQASLTLENFTATVVETPGHTAGCVTFIFDETHAFSGDFIFRQSIGRTDLYSGSMETMRASLDMFKQTMPETLLLYPGHGPLTSLQQELKDNPFLK